MIRRLQANVRVAAAQIEERSPDTADPQQVPTPEADQSVLANDVVARVPSTRWLKKVEVKTK
jgi:molybdopterin biosynthesis enzyme